MAKKKSAEPNDVEPRDLPATLSAPTAAAETKNRSPALSLPVRLALYLALTCAVAIVALAANWPDETGATEGATPSSPPILLLAVFAGVIGSSLHALQSLSAFVGNRTFEPSWTLWYCFRPLIGASLGLLTALALNAGLAGGTGTLSPYGLTALAGLAGLFSKTALAKLEEVFETVFQPKSENKDPLNGSGNP